MKKTIFIFIFIFIFILFSNIAYAEKSDFVIKLEIGGELYNKDQIYSFLKEIYSDSRSPNITILNGENRTVKYLVIIDGQTYKDDKKNLEYGQNLVKGHFIKEYAKAANLNFIPSKDAEQPDIIFVFTDRFSVLKDIEYFRRMELSSTHTEDDARKREKLWLSLDQPNAHGTKPDSYKGNRLVVSGNAKYHILKKSFILIRSEDVNSDGFKVQASQNICRVFLQNTRHSDYLSKSCGSTKSNIKSTEDGVLGAKDIVFALDLALINALYSINDIAELDTAQAIDKIMDFLISKYKI